MTKRSYSNVLNIFSHFRYAQGNFIDELRQGVDYGPDADDEYGLPWEDYIEDNIAEEEEPKLEPEAAEPELEPEIAEQPRINGYQAGDVDFFEGEELPVVKSYDNINALIRDSLRRHVVKIDYTTRHGVFTSDRIVEPHRTFTAGTGNQILLTFDRSVGNGAGGIRGFIISQIHPGAVLYENNFQIHPEIMKTRVSSPLVIRKPH